MVRETRYLYVGNLPKSITEANILEHFSNYGKIQSVRMAPPVDDRPNAIIAFMDIKCASKAHSETIIIEGESVITAYNENSSVVTLTVPIQQPSIIQTTDSEILNSDNITNDENQENKNQESVNSENDVNENIKLLNKDLKVKTSLLSKYSNFKAFKKNHINDSSNKRPEKKLASIIQVPEQSGLSSGESTGVDPNDNRPLGMLMKGFPTRSTDTSIRDGLFHEYKKFGKVMGVQVIGQGDDRHAIVCFKKAEDAAKALESSYDKKFFGTKVQVFPHEGYGNQVKKLLDEHDELHHKATRTLFVGNLDKVTTKEFLLNYFEKYGQIIDIDVKNQGQTSVYAFIQYDNIKSVVKALRELDDEFINDCKVKVGFGKSLPTTCLWLGGIPETVSEKWLAIQHLINFGHLLALYIDRVSGRGLAYYETIEQAIAAVQEMKTRIVLDRKLEVDFASRDCQNLLLDAMERSGQLRPGDRPEERLGRPSGYPSMHISEPLRPPKASFDGTHPRSRFYGGHEFGPRTNFRPNFFHGQGRGYFKKIDAYEPLYEHREMPVLPKYYEPPARAVDDSYENYPVYTRDSYSKERRHSLSPEKSSYNISSHHTIGADSPRSSGRFQSPIRSSRTSLEREERHHRDSKNQRRSPKRRAKENPSGHESDSKYKRSRVTHSSRKDSTSRHQSSQDKHSDRPDKPQQRLSESDRRRCIEVSDRSHSEEDIADDKPENDDEVLDLEKKKRQLLEMLQAMEEDASVATATAAATKVYEAEDLSTGSDVEIVEKPDVLIKKELNVESGEFLLQKMDNTQFDSNQRYSPIDMLTRQASPNKKSANHKIEKLIDSDEQSNERTNRSEKKKLSLKERYYRKRQLSRSSSESSLQPFEAYSPAMSAASGEMHPTLQKEEALPSASHDDFVKLIPCSPNNEMLIDPRPPPMTINPGEFMNLPLPDYAFDLRAMQRRVKERNKLEENDDDYANTLLDDADTSKVINTMVDAVASIKKTEDINPLQIDEEIRGLIKEVHVEVSSDAKHMVSESSPRLNELLDNKNFKPDLLEHDEELRKKPLDRPNFILNKTKKDDSFNNLDNLSLEERIKVLDEKLNMIQQGSSRFSSSVLPSHSTISTSDISSIASSSVLDYREKYRRHRRDPVTSTATLADQKMSEPSDLAKILLSRSSVFDQDTKRLEMLNKLKQDSSNLSLDDIHRNNVDYSSIRSMFPLSIATSWSSTLNNISQPLSPAPTANLYPTVTPGGVVWNTLPTPIVPSPVPQQKPYFQPETPKYPYVQTQSLQNPVVNSSTNNVQISDPRKLARSMNNAEFGSTPIRKNCDSTISPQAQSNVPFVPALYQTHTSIDAYKSENVMQKSKEITSPLVSILKKQSSREEAAAAASAAAAAMVVSVTTVPVAPVISSSMNKSNLDTVQNADVTVKKRADSISSHSDKSNKSTNNFSTKINSLMSQKILDDSPSKKDNLSNHHMENKSRPQASQKQLNNKLGEKLFDKNISQSVAKHKHQSSGKPDDFQKDNINKVNEEVLSNVNDKPKKNDLKDVLSSNDPQNNQSTENKTKDKIKSSKQEKNENKYKRIKMDLSDDRATPPILTNENELPIKSFKNKVSSNSDKHRSENTNKNDSKIEHVKSIDEPKQQQINKVDKKIDNNKSKFKSDSESKNKNESENQSKNKVDNKANDEIKSKPDERKNKKETANKHQEDSTKKHKSQIDSKSKNENEFKCSVSKKDSQSSVKSKDKNSKESTVDSKLGKELNELKSKLNDSTKKSSRDSKNSKRSEDQKNKERQKELKMIAEALGEDISQYVSMYDMVKRRSCKDTSRSNDETKTSEKIKPGNHAKNLTSLSSESDALSHTSDSIKNQQKLIKSKPKLPSSSSSSFDLSSDEEAVIPGTPKKLKKPPEKNLTVKPVVKAKDLMSTSSSEDEEFILKSQSTKDAQSKKNTRNKNQVLQPPQQRAHIYTSSSSDDEEPSQIETKASSTSLSSKELASKNDVSNSKDTGKKSNNKIQLTKQSAKNIIDTKKDNFSKFLSDESSDSEASETDIKSKLKDASKINKSNPVSVASEKTSKVKKPPAVTKSKNDELKDILKTGSITDTKKKKVPTATLR